jgi:hypothetical protein
MFAHKTRGIETNSLLSLEAFSNVYCCWFLEKAEWVVWGRTATHTLKES